MLGNDADSTAIWARAYHDRLDQGDVDRAARCAFWSAFGLMLTGETARAGGWLARAERLLDDGRRDCVEHGYRLVPGAFQNLDQADNATAIATFTRIAEIGERFGDADLVHRVAAGSRVDRSPGSRRCRTARTPTRCGCRARPVLRRPALPITR
jgi:hypothetical protein